VHLRTRDPCIPAKKLEVSEFGALYPQARIVSPR